MLDAARQRELLGRREQLHTADLSQVEADRVEAAALQREVECRSAHFTVALESLVAPPELDALLDEVPDQLFELIRAQINRYTAGPGA